MVEAELESQEGSHLAWLHTVARRRLIDDLRRQSRSGVNHLALDETVLANEEAASPEYGEELTKALRDAIGRLPHEQQDVVLRRLFTGCGFAEIASDVGESEATCRQRFLRGLRALRRDLEREGFSS